MSTTLTNNVEKSLARILTAQVQQFVVPAITSATIQAVTAQVSDQLDSIRALFITLHREDGDTTLKAG